MDVIESTQKLVDKNGRMFLAHLNLISLAKDLSQIHLKVFHHYKYIAKVIIGNDVV